MKLEGSKKVLRDCLDAFVPASTRKVSHYSETDSYPQKLCAQESRISKLARIWFNDKTRKIARTTGLVAAALVVGYGVALATGVIAAPDGNSILSGISQVLKNDEAAPSSPASIADPDKESVSSQGEVNTSGVSSESDPTDDSQTDSASSITCPTGRIEIALTGSSSATALWMPELQNFYFYDPVFTIPVEVRIATSEAVNFQGNIYARSSASNEILDGLSANTHVTGVAAQAGKTKVIEMGNHTIGGAFAESRTALFPGVSGWDIVSNDLSANWADGKFFGCAPPAVTVTNAHSNGSDIVGGGGSFGWPLTWWNF
jgi:hypothetical protein